MLAWAASFPRTSKRLECSPLKDHFIGYLDHLAEQCYPPKTIRKYADRLLRFGEYLAKQDRLDVTQFSESVEPFLTELASKLPSAAEVKPTLSCFLRYLKQTGVIPAVEHAASTDPHAELVEAYCTFLRTQRALHERTVRRIRSTCRRFMVFRASEGDMPLHSLQPEVIHRFVIAGGQQYCRLSLSGECSSLRGFLAFLHRRGAVALDLSRVVVAPRVYQHDRCPRYLTRSQIETVLAGIDRTTPVGRRDYAMLMLLTAYGLRGGETARLRLDDIDWRNNHLHIRGRKAGNSTTYPLASSVADGIIDYLRHGRPVSSHREVFLSVIAPYRPLRSGFALASHLVKYLQRASIAVDHPGTHLFRYSCAQRLFEGGMPLKHIGDYLGHADLHSTQRYTKIAFDQLREVALGDAEDLL
jgi:site-specific recombinase XerD